MRNGFLQYLAGLPFAGSAYQAFPLNPFGLKHTAADIGVFGSGLQAKQFDDAAAWLLKQQSCFDYPGIVKDKEAVTGYVLINIPVNIFGNLPFPVQQ